MMILQSPESGVGKQLQCNTWNCRAVVISGPYLTGELMRDAAAFYGWTSNDAEDYDLCQECSLIYGAADVTQQPLGILNIEQKASRASWRKWARR